MDNAGYRFVNQAAVRSDPLAEHHLIEKHMDCKTYDDDHGPKPTTHVHRVGVALPDRFADDGGELATGRPTCRRQQHSRLYARRRQLT